MNSKIDKTNAMRVLDQKKLNYKALSYPCSADEVLSGVEVAAYLGVSPLIVYKTLVVCGDRTGIVVAVIPSNHSLDLKTLAKVSGNKKVEMIPVKDIEKVTGYIRGGCSPIGMKKLFPTFFSELCVNEPFIIFSGGKRGRQIEMNPNDLLKIVPFQYAQISHYEEEADHPLE